MGFKKDKLDIDFEVWLESEEQSDVYKSILSTLDSNEEINDLVIYFSHLPMLFQWGVWVKFYADSGIEISITKHKGKIYRWHIKRDYEDLEECKRGSRDRAKMENLVLGLAKKHYNEAH